MFRTWQQRVGQQRLPGFSEVSGVVSDHLGSGIGDRVAGDVGLDDENLRPSGDWPRKLFSVHRRRSEKRQAS